jgi:hypothetical protein
MSLPTFFLGIATAVDSLEISGTSDLARQTAARVRASLLTEDWEWLQERSLPDRRRILDGLGAWSAASPDFDALAFRLKGTVRAFWKIYDDPGISFPIGPPQIRGVERYLCPAWPNTLEASLEVSRIILPEDSFWDRLYSWDLTTRRRIVSAAYPDADFRVQAF